ncbi:MAG: HAD family phosphatase [Mycobacteriales bacterium]
MPLAAVLWDMDGLLVDTEPVWTVAEEELALRLGGVWSTELKARIAGTRLDVAVPTILEHYGVTATEDAVVEASTWLLDRMVSLFSDGVTPLPGAFELLAGLEVPVALVSSSYRVLVDAVLHRTGLAFDVTVAGDEVRHGKPDPTPYLTAAGALGVDPQACVVLEDSAAGVRAGLSAGCAVVAVPSVPGTTVPADPRCLVRPSLVGLTGDHLAALV